MKLSKILLSITSLVLGASSLSANTQNFKIVNDGVRQPAIEIRDVLGNTTRYTGFETLNKSQLRSVLRTNVAADLAPTNLFGPRSEMVSPVDFRRHVVGMSPSLVPAGSTSTGFGTVIFYTVTTDLGTKYFFATNVFNITPADLDNTHGPNNTAFHIHRGFPGGGGPILIDVDFEGDQVESANGMVAYGAKDLELTQGAYTAPFTEAEILSFLDTGEAYIALHTVANPTGAIRGNF